MYQESIVMGLMGRFKGWFPEWYSYWISVDAFSVMYNQLSLVFSIFKYLTENGIRIIKAATQVFIYIFL